MPPGYNWGGAQTDAELIRLWLAQFQSKETQKVYRLAVEDFLGLIPKPLREVTLQDLLGYQAYLERKGLSAHTIHLRQSAIKSLYTFAVYTGYLDWDVGRAWKSMYIPKVPAPRYLTEAEVAQLIQAAKRPRDRALLRFLYQTGARVGEVAGLTWERIRQTEDGGAVVTIHGKDYKTRHIAISPDLLNELKAISPTQKGPVFVSQRRRPLSARRIEGLVAAIGRKILGKPVSPHWLRHAMATHAYNRGADLTKLSQSMGHKSVEGTVYYLHSESKDIPCPGDYLPKVY